MNINIKPESIDFNLLINDMKISNIFQSKFIDKLKETFTEDELKWYIANLYVYLNYNSTTEYPIDLEKIYKIVGFANKGNAKRTLENNFTENEDYRVIIHTEKNPKGGRPEEIIMLNVDTFKNICMLAKTEKSKQIRRYYIKLENIFNKLINEERLENQNIIENQKIELNDKDKIHNLDLKMNKQEILLNTLKTKKCIYLGEIEKNIIKIGSSKNVSERIKGLNKTFGNCIFLDIFICEDFRDIESNILSDDIIIEHNYKTPINGYKSSEVIKLTDKFTYQHLLKIVKKHIDNTNYLTPIELLENKRLDTENKKLDLIEKLLDKGYNPEIITDFTKNINQSLTENIDNNIIEKKNNNIDFKLKTKTPKGRKVQQIDPLNFKLKNIYDSMVYLLRDNPTFHKSCIDKAIKNNTIYKEYRWSFVEKNQDSNIVNIAPTIELKMKSPIIETIIELNEEKTKILNTYNTKDLMMKKFHIAKITLNNIINKKEKYKNCYFIKYSDCPKELLDNYSEKIEKKYHIHAKPIKQINHNTSEIIIFNSLHEISMKLGISSKTIIDAIDNKYLCNGYLWEYSD